MHLATYAMTHEFANDSVAMRLAKCLHCITDVTDALALLGTSDSLIEGFLCNIEQLSDFVRHLANTKCVARIAVEVIQ